MSATKDYFVLNNMVNIPIDGEIPLYYDREALTDYLKNEIEPHTMHFSSLKERFQYLIQEDYVDEEVVGLYRGESGEIDSDFLEDLYQKIKEHDFAFKSFMGAYKFYNQYALKTDDSKTYLESFEDRVFLNALYLGNGDQNLATKIAEEMITQGYQPATPTFLNAGKKRRGEMVSCFLIDLDDSMLSIGRGVNSALQLSRLGGGVGVNLSNLRASGSPIKGIKHASSGVLPVMKLLEDSFSYSNQLGQRNGAGVVYLNVFHQDILAFLSTKKENADEKIRVKTLSLGLVVPDKYYELIKTNQPMYLFNPYHVEKVYGKPFSYVDITAEYDRLVANPAIEKTVVQARELEQEISRLQQESGYPYILNIDVANRLYHTIGLGAMGLHTAFALHQIKYGSKESLEFTEAYFLALNYYSLVSSNRIARERHETFYEFADSRYADGSYFSPYVEQDFVFRFPKIAAIFKDIPIPTKEDWKVLREKVMKDGLYHRNRLAVAPNGSISYINETSASLHPITQLVENRQEKKVGSIFYPAPYLSNDTLPFYETAYNMDQRKIIDVYAVAQKHIDQGMSLTLFMRSQLPEGLYEWKTKENTMLTTRDLNRLRNYAWQKGIKSLYYVRTYTEDDEFSSVNSCESCMI